jgi:hypothetical protein
MVITSNNLRESDEEEVVTVLPNRRPAAVWNMVYIDFDLTDFSISPSTGRPEIRVYLHTYIAE